MKSHVYICKDEETNKNLSLTYLKKYEIIGISSDDGCYTIKNDRNILMYVMFERFISLSEYRKNKIKNILLHINE
mgnify:CR=1 FL=1